MVGESREVASRHIMARLGLEPVLGDLMPRHGAAEPWDVLTAMRGQTYRELVADPQVLQAHRWPHAIAFLRLVRSARFKTGLATMSQRTEALHVLPALGLEGKFDVILTRNDVSRPKPDPEIYLMACRRLGVRPAECLAIEDSPAGVRAAGIATVPVATFFTRSGLLAANLPPECLTLEPADLIPAVERCLRAKGERFSEGGTTKWNWEWSA